MRVRKAAIAATLAAMGLLVVWRWGAGTQRGELPTRAALNHMWIERMPVNPKDMVRQFVAFETERRRLGLAATMSHWRVLADRFTWKLDGKRMEAQFPQAERTVHLDIRTWHCKNEAPEPFELCLELKIGKKTLAFFSREDWRVDPNGRMATPVPFTTAQLELPDQDVEDQDAEDQDADKSGDFEASVMLPPAWQ